LERKTTENNSVATSYAEGGDKKVTYLHNNPVAEGIVASERLS
jgi:hypothetical protein